MSNFYIDESKGTKRNYQNLLDDINGAVYRYKFIYTDDNYQIFLNLLLAAVNNGEAILLDPDFSKNEIIKSIGSYKVVENKLPVKKSNYKSLEQLLKSVLGNNGFHISLFTSGTTGKPKKVTHSYNSLTRGVKINDDHASDIWGFAYNPTHIAGLQVFFQAVMNQNTIINIFNLKRDDIFKTLSKYSVTHISATPTFFRLLLPSNDKYTSVKKVTSGGEKFDPKLCDSLGRIFPNADFLNIYASTEAGTVLVAKGELFQIRNGFEQYIEIKNNKLFLHKKLLGVLDQINMDFIWYDTGDIVEIVSRNPLTFKFVQRDAEVINVGGYKINPAEIETVINSHPDVINSKVYARKNSVVGQLLYADVVSKVETLDDLNLKRFLMEILQNFKIPRIINFVDKIEMTRTGKVRRDG